MKKVFKNISKGTLCVGVVLFIAHITNTLLFFISTLNKKITEYNSHFYDWKFGKIHYTTYGTGKPLLCVHGLENGASSYEFHSLIKTLSKTNKVYSIDLLGYGNSEKPKITYTAYLYVQLLSDFIKNVIGQNTNIITSGKSNSFVTMLSIQGDANIEKMIFINPEELNALAKNPTKRNLVCKHIIELPIIGTALYLFLSSKPKLKQLFKKQYFFNSAFISKKIFNSFYENSHLGEASNKYIYASNAFRYNNVNISHALEQTNNSIYIIQGSERNEYHEDVLNAYKKVNASIEGTLVYKTKAFPHIERPSSTLEILKLFLDE